MPCHVKVGLDTSEHRIGQIGRSKKHPKHEQTSKKDPKSHKKLKCMLDQTRSKTKIMQDPKSQNLTFYRQPRGQRPHQRSSTEVEKAQGWNLYPHRTGASHCNDLHNESSV